MTLRRTVLALLVAVGAALIVAPLSMSMFSRTSAGEQTVDTFRPIMQPASVHTTVYYYDEVFTPLRQVVPLMTQQNVDRFDGYLQGMRGMRTDAARLVPALAAAMHTTPARVQTLLGSQFPSLAAMLQRLPAMSRDFGALLAVMGRNVRIFQQVPAGLDHYKALVSTMQSNVDNYAAIDAMPRMSLFPWFFVAQGILVVLLAGGLLVAEWRPGGFHLPTSPRPVAH